MIEKIRKFFNEVVAELKKVSWSTRQELIDATWIVLVSSLCLAIFIGSIDIVLSKLLGVIIR